MANLACERTAPLQVLSRLGQAATNDPQARQVMRAAERGGMLDVHHGETGYRRIMAPGSPDGELLRLAATTKNDPFVVTVGIDVKTIEPAVEPPPSVHRLQLLARWGTGKGTSSAIIDARQGVQFTIAANVLTVDVRYVGANGPTFRVGASSAYGSPEGCDVSLTFTEAEETLAGPGSRSAPFAIPSYATRVAWFSPDIPAAAPIPSATIQQLASPGVGARIVSQVAPPPGEFVAVQNGAEVVRLVNDAAAARTYFVLFELHI
jgi:hypothetical protein